MPTYDYECENCGYSFEAFHQMSAEPLLECPECHLLRLIKLIGMGSAVIIKGTETPCRGGRELKKKDKLGKGKYKTDTFPPWRDGPIDKNILKNPERYVKTGEI